VLKRYYSISVTSLGLLINSQCYGLEDIVTDINKRLKFAGLNSIAERVLYSYQNIKSVIVLNPIKMLHSYHKASFLDSQI
jgi:hypothetical protein